ncbi:MAG: ABC transporter substrate-binding protein [Alphaproteobacteria bacterium]|nr:ABC transporter substrate-binding protein [Alphaproteobacteria bacterium]
MNGHGKRRLGAVLSLFGAMVLGAGAALAADPIRIGAPLILSGTGAFVGSASKNAMEMVGERVNAAGGIGGRKIEFLFYDTEAKPDVAVRMVKRLIESDNVTAIVGVSSSWEALPVLPIVEKAEVPTLIPASTDQIVEPVRKWVFKTPAGDRIVVAKMLDHMRAKGIKKMALVSTQDGYGNGGREQVLKQAKDFGIEVVFDDRYTMEDTDVTPMLAKIKRSEAKAVVNWSANRAPVVMTLNYRQLGIDLPLYHGHGALSDGYLKAVGDKADGVMISGVKFQAGASLPDGDPQKKAIGDFVAAYKAKYGAEPNQFGSAAYDALNILLSAIAKAGTDKVKLRDAIEATAGHVGTGGTYNYSAADHAGLKLDAVVVYKAEGGAWKLAN